MSEDDPRDDHHRGGRKASRLRDPGEEDQEQQGDECPREPRADHPDVHAALDAARRPGGQRQRDERGRQRQPAAARHARERQEGRQPRREVRHPDERLIGSRDRQHGEGRAVEERSRVREARRVELQLGIARPPVRVPRPRRRAVRDDVPEAVELAGVIVVAGGRDAERRRAEEEPIRDEQREGKKPVASHRRGSYFN